MKLLVYLFLLTASSCSSLNFLKIDKTIVRFSSKLTDVTIKLVESNKVKVLGTTPLELSFNNDKDGPIRLVVTKEGYISKDLFIDLKSSKVLSIDIELTRFIDNLKLTDIAYTEFFNEIAINIQKAYNFIQQKNYKDALRILYSLEAKFPQSYIVYDMLGSVHYLTRNYSEALLYFNKSLLINPNNFQTKTIIQTIKAKRVL